MSELPTVSEKSFRYPALYRGVALFGALLFGFILLGSVIAEVEAIKNSRVDAVLHVIGFISGALLLLVGIDFATRSITVTPGGLQVRWLLRRSVIPWPDVLGWNYLPLNLIHLRFRQGRGVYVWPLLEDYLDLLSAIDARRFDQFTRER
jgi:hypothetical protein